MTGVVAPNVMLMRFAIVVFVNIRIFL